MTTYKLPERHNEFWSREEDAQLNELRMTDKSIYDVAKELKRTPMAILLRVRQLVGIDSIEPTKESSLYNHHTRWTTSDNEYLINQFNVGRSINELAVHFDRSHKAIESHLREILIDDKALDKTYQRIRKLRKL